MLAFRVTAENSRVILDVLNGEPDKPDFSRILQMVTNSSPTYFVAGTDLAGIFVDEVAFNQGFEIIKKQNGGNGRFFVERR